jgi:putative spermidine/putrescine transport system ATP-binding protein
MSTIRPMTATRGASVALRAIAKRYAGKPAVDDLSLDVAAGEILALLGPSGCGKSTTLGMIAGLVEPDAGTILVDGTEIQDTPPWQRNLGMLFQNYALFPHLTVAGNVAFGLEMRRVAKAEIAERVGRALAAVELEAFAERMPSQLSGGQQQRVALARALVCEPRVLLLDEPFGALDRRLREAMQVELRRLCTQLGLTAVLVTHDQEEALTLADRIAVMREARLEQVADARTIYERPRTRFVADFLGTSSFLEGEVLGAADGITRLRTTGGHLVAGSLETPAPAGTRRALAIRAEKVDLVPGPPEAGAENAIPGHIEQVVFKGHHLEIYLDAGPLGTIVSFTRFGDGVARPPEAGEVWTARWSAANAVVVQDS